MFQELRCARKGLFCGRLAVAALLGGAATAAFAQAQPANEPAGGASDVANQDIVVTARQRKESLLNVPVAVAALGQQTLERYAAADLTKVAQLAPNVVLTKGQTGGGANIAIRGLGSSSGDQALEQTVSVSIDGVQVGRGRVLASGLFDLQQVEILKGPQALYFGKNSPAGVISLSSNGPTSNFSGYVRAGHEFVADETFIEGAVSIPISDVFKVRLAGRGRYMEGWLHNTAIAQPNPIDPRYPVSGAPRSRDPRTKQISGRLTAVYEPSSETKVTFRMLADASDEGGLGSTLQALCFSPSTIPTTVGVPNTGSECTLDNHIENSGLFQNFPTKGWPGIKDGRPYAGTTIYLPSLTINQQFGQLSLTSITGYFDLTFNGGGAVIPGSFGAIYSTLGEHTRTFTQELRLNSSFDGPLNLTVGGYYGHNKMDGYVAGLQLLAPTSPDPVTGQSFSFERRTRASGETWSGFGQVRWNVAPTLELAAGVRYTHETKSATTGNVFVHPNFQAAFAAAGLFLTSNRSEDNWSPEFTATWHPAEHQTLYAAYKTGYKSGGISQPSVVTKAFNSDNLTFRPERIQGGEIGYKAQLFDRRVRLDLTAYSYTVTDLQVVAFDAATTANIILNAAKARTRGIEGSLDVTVSNQLSLRASGGYNIAKYLSFPKSPCFLLQTAAEGCVGKVQDLTGRPLPRAPKWTGNFGGTFQQPVTSRLTALVDIDASLTSGYYAQDNEHPLSYQKGYALLNAGVRLRSIDGWELGLIGRNLTNKYYLLNSVDLSAGGRNQFQAYSNRPREIMLQVGYSF